MACIWLAASLAVAARCLLGTVHGCRRARKTQKKVWACLRRTKPALARRCASDAEEQSALYNMACAYAALGKRDSALTCLEVRAASWCHVLGSGPHVSKSRFCRLSWHRPACGDNARQ